MDDVVQTARGFLELFVSPSMSIYWGYLLSAAVIAVGVYLWGAGRRRRVSLGGVIRFLLPRRIVLHRSTRHDLGVFVVNALLHTFLFAGPLHGLSSFVSARTYSAGAAVFGAVDAPLAGWPFVLAATVVVFAAADFAFYVAHRLLHRIPLLWELHKVHHSAPVLTPFTVFRRHPGDVLFDGVVSGIVLGLVYGALGYAGGSAVDGYTILGVNALLFAALLFGFNLQHSHVWLRFGPLERVLVSPAAHHLHHSDRAEHFDRNFGNLLSIWDRLFGTWLSPPKRRPALRFGLGDETRAYRSIPAALRRAAASGARPSLPAGRSPGVDRRPSYPSTCRAPAARAR